LPLQGTLSYLACILQVRLALAYREIDRPKRLVFTWGIDGMSSDETVVTIEIDPAEAGCELQLEHAKVWTAYAGRTREGWTKLLDQLAEIVCSAVRHGPAGG